jgi:hypothetical protein
MLSLVSHKKKGKLMAEALAIPVGEKPFTVEFTLGDYDDLLSKIHSVIGERALLDFAKFKFQVPGDQVPHELQAWVNDLGHELEFNYLASTIAGQSITGPAVILGSSGPESIGLSPDVILEIDKIHGQVLGEVSGS